MQHFPAAPWPTALKVTSALGALVLLGVGYAAFRVIPPWGFAHRFGWAVALVFPAIALGSLLFVVRGYDVGPSRLEIRRLLWSTWIPLDGLSRVSREPEAVKCSLRIFGNGGLFSFTGLYQNKTIGRFRLFATDLTKAVILTLPRRTVVVTPAAPHAFAEFLSRSLPGAHAPGPPPGIAPR